jgi:uncharacterized protein (TIGR03643 family)
MDTKVTSLTAIDIEHIILMAWGDTISFETITREYGLTHNQIVRLMRTHQSQKTYTRWRERVTTRTQERSKHEKLSVVSSRRQKFAV